MLGVDQRPQTGDSTPKNSGRLSQGLQPMEEVFSQIENATLRLSTLADRMLGSQPPLPDGTDTADCPAGTLEAQIHHMTARFETAVTDLRHQVSRLEEI